MGEGQATARINASIKEVYDQVFAELDGASLGNTRQTVFERALRNSADSSLIHPGGYPPRKILGGD